MFLLLNIDNNPNDPIPLNVYDPNPPS